MAESTLSEFPPVPYPGTITVAEYGAQLISLASNPENPKDALEFCDKLIHYHRIDASNWGPKFQHKIPSIRTTNIRDSLIVSRNEGLLKGMWDAW
jgi:hypothetical protein